MILHEIGHALDPEGEFIEKEYRADAFAVERGSRELVISSLEHARALWPAEFDLPHLLQLLSLQRALDQAAR